ncbi:MAG: hypothetical protein PHI85_01000 [Victivallaceae bacterium]|nr:hypothetical protein [Victivallaceae bacterium]
MNLLGNLYVLEREAKQRSGVEDSKIALLNERKRVRRLSKKLVVDFFEMCEAVQKSEIPSTPLAKAVNYAEE